MGISLTLEAPHLKETVKLSIEYVFVVFKPTRLFSLFLY